jgi:hypothetical protein
MLPGLTAALLLALPGLIPALLLNRDVSPETAQQAASIYVYQRLSHHLVFHRFPHWFMARQAFLLIAWGAVCVATPCRLETGRLGQRPLRGFVSGAVLIALAGVVIDQSLLLHLDLAARLLRFYWYRLADAMLPAGAALAMVVGLSTLSQRRPRLAQVLLVLAMLAAVANLGCTHLRRWPDRRPRADVLMLPSYPDSPQRTREIYRDWLAACRWIEESSAPDARFITPRMQQTFKWYAGRSEVCSYKDIPQDAASLVEWWECFRELYPRPVNWAGLAIHGEEGLRELGEKYDADYVVIDRTRSRRPLLLPRVYPASPASSSTYEVYRLPSRVP